MSDAPISRALIVISRQLTLTKEEWRKSDTQRTLPPIDPDPMTRRLWVTCPPTLSGNVMLESQWGSLYGPEIQLVPHGPRFAGVFAFSFVNETVQVTLREERCRSQLGTPRRHTRQIARLRPWHPLRVLINGRQASSSGQRYLVREYHLTLCTNPLPDEAKGARLIDLQADLM